MSDSPKHSINPDNLSVLEELYERYQTSPDSVAPDLQDYFSEVRQGNGRVLGSGANGNHAAGALYVPKLSAEESERVTDLNMRALLYLQAFRRNGHFYARIDPLGLSQNDPIALAPEAHGLSQEDLGREVTTRIAGKWVTGRLGDFVDRMRQTYCSSIAAEFFYLREEERRSWLIERMESEANAWPVPHEMREMIHDKLVNAEALERFVARHYIGKKRFSLEGAESLIPTVSAAVEFAGGFGVEQIVFGMAHRGRLNLLCNVLGKKPAQIFAEFNENVPEDMDIGDVKYHLGFSHDYRTLAGKPVHLSLAFNPSHLEVINPVVMGSVRARQTRGRDKDRKRFMPVIIHGDAAFAGQGINYEILNMSRLEGYTVGGTFHIIVNNQLGFTTSPHEARSTQYCTDLAKMLQVPIFHVNGDDPEACYRAVQLCMEWRQRYQSDVFLDLICYRRWGHNETDEPTFTQPVEYHKIKNHPTTLTLYEQHLRRAGFEERILQRVHTRVDKRLTEALKRVEASEVKVQSETLRGDWKGFRKENARSNPETKVELPRLVAVAEKVTEVPEHFTLNPKLRRLLEGRRAMVAPGAKVDWGMAETLAFGSLLLEGTPIRLTGQDVLRGTFSHRHAGLADFQTGERHIPLQNLARRQGRFEIINSLLSEVGALGFEFGYSLADPRTLVVWEAQFGDFINGAQVIIDQFISSSEAKWNRMSGLVLLLPHGYEGQGPEHSSARLERCLQLCSKNNIQVCNCTTPAQYFHLLRRQMKRNYRKPLILMSPKSLLRHPLVQSPIEEFTGGRFVEVLPETDETVLPEEVHRVLLCSGKLYYELFERRQELARKGVAIVRVEQLYPFPYDPIATVFQTYRAAEDICWVQEEPRNQGAWSYVEHWLHPMLGSKQSLRYIGRPASPSPATGYYKVHVKQQQELVELALAE